MTLAADQRPLFLSEIMGIPLDMWVERNQTFPYSEDGLEAALAFAKTVGHKWEEFWSRD